MSYNDGWTQENGYLPISATYGGSTGYCALDVAALQAMYGANTATNGGSNVYTLPAYNAAGAGYRAIWDTNGVDEIRHVGSSESTINLRAATLDYSVLGGGIVSHVAGVQGGFTIAEGVIIENASGGSRNDRIVGNTAENTLRGNNGNDVFYSLSDGFNNNSIFGGRGNDVIHVASGSGSDVVQGNEGNDIAVVLNNGGSFFGGSGTDTIRFVSAENNYLFTINGSNYEFFNVVTRDNFTVSNDVEIFQFSNGQQQHDLSGLTLAMNIADVETTGTVLQHATQGVYLLGGSSSNIALTLNGQVVGQNTLAGWGAVQAEAFSGGYKVLWQHTDGSNAEWVTDSAGQYVSGETINNVVDVEVFYGADINCDGTIGHFTTAIESNGFTSLASSTHGFYLIDGNEELTLDSTDIGPGRG